MDSVRVRARELRRDMTEPEYRLWHALKHNQLGAKFRRQAPKGPYILDFYCPQHKLVIEVDGESHAMDSRDERRDAWLTNQGFRVLRFWNHDIMRNLDGVVAVIYRELRGGG